MSIRAQGLRRNHALGTERAGGVRLQVVDRMRGLAVVFMFVMHTADGWLRPALRDGEGWTLIRSMGGMAAPLFLLLAGVSLGLQHIAGTRDEGDITARQVARGLQILVLGYLLRLQMWMIDGGGYAHGRVWLAALPLAAGYGLLWHALQRRRAGVQPAAALALVTGGLGLVQLWFPARLEGLLRVDILQAIGASIVVVATVSKRLGVTTRPYLGLVMGAAVALATPLARTLMPGPLPPPLAAYLAFWPAPDGGAPWAMFPLFPWLAYAFFGLGIGLYWGRPREVAARDRRIIISCAAGAVVALASCEAIPFVYAWVHEHPLLQQPIRVAYRTGLALVLGGGMLIFDHVQLARGSPLVLLGRASLLVYWVHLEFAFGLAARPLARESGFATWSVCLLVLTACMGTLAWLRLHVPTAGFRSFGAIRQGRS